MGLFKTVYHGEDITLIDYLKSFSLAKNKINHLIDEKCIKINDVMINKREYILIEDDIIEIDTTYYDDIYFEPVTSKLQIIYEDDYILVVNKPKGIIIYSDNLSDITMASYVSYYYEQTHQDCCVRHVHRLDKDTTGCLLYAKDILTHSYLSTLIENHKFTKEYKALVTGKTPKSGIIDAPIGTSRHDNNTMVVSKNGKEAYTNFELIKYVGNNSLIKVNIKTGRTHQIRVHMASINHPLVGDTIYGKNNGIYFLDSSHLSFFYPYLNRRVDFYSNN